LAKTPVTAAWFARVKLDAVWVEPDGCGADRAVLTGDETVAGAAEEVPAGVIVVVTAVSGLAADVVVVLAGGGVCPGPARGLGWVVKAV
jgi:hypothetical protein